MPEINKEITRRELLTFWKKSSTEIPVHEEVKSEVVASAAPTMSRRQLIIDAGIVAAALVAGYCFGTPIAEASDSIPQRSPAPVQPKEPNSENEPTLIDTAVVSAVYKVADLISFPILTAFKIPYSGGLDKKSQAEFIKQPLYKSILEAGVLWPTIEEAVFRALPSFFIAGHLKEDAWQIGIPISVLFAYLHNFKTDVATDNLEFVKDKIPLHQFFGGLFFWWMMRERGFPHAVVAHGTRNSVGLIIGKMFYKAYPKQL